MIEGRTEDETVKLTAAALHVSLAEAAFIIAIDRGEIDGDVVELDEAGHEIRRPPLESLELE